MLRRLRKLRIGLARAMLAVFIAGCLNMAIQSCLMAATLDDCHESSRLPAHSEALQHLSGDLDADCAYCAEIDPRVEDSDTSLAYSCVSMTACSDEVPQLGIHSAELQLKPCMMGSSSSLQASAAASACRNRVPSTVGAQTAALNIQYCRFLI